MCRWMGVEMNIQNNMWNKLKGFEYFLNALSNPKTHVFLAVLTYKMASINVQR